MNNNALAQNFSFGSLIKFAVPNIIMMIFLSMYTIVDGFFISRFVGTVALSATNMVFPLICGEMALGIMIATGSSAIIAILLGEKKEELARDNFTFIIFLSFVIGLLIAIFGNIFIENIISMTGASEVQYQYCKDYIRILFYFAPAFFLQTVFQTLFVTAGKPMIGLISTIMAGIANMVLDYVFIVPFDLGISGAALATGIGYVIPALIGLIYFKVKKDCPLHFVNFNFDWTMFKKACFNGSSEMVTNIANAVTTFLFNIIFMRFYGEDGVASITIVMYFQFVFSAVFFGFSLGVAPVISYKYGMKDKNQIKQVVKNSLIIIGICSIISFTLSILTLRTALGIFTVYGSNVYNITLEGFYIFAASFIIMGFNIFASSMFTAFSDGVTSALISFARTFIFLIGFLIIMPLLIGKMGAWAAVPLAELFGLFISVGFIISKRSKYYY